MLAPDSQGGYDSNPLSCRNCQSQCPQAVMDAKRKQTTQCQHDNNCDSWADICKEIIQNSEEQY